jgi:hypothetical protein
MKTPLLLLSAAALALTALAPSGQAYTGPYRDVNPCESGFGAYAVVGDLCLDTQATWCTLWIEWHAIPSTPTCLVAPLAASSDVQCMDVYGRTDVGTYSVVRRDSCSPPELYQCPYEGAPTNECQDLLTLESSASVDCYPVYSRTNVGTYSIVRRTSCSPPEVYSCPYENAPIQGCENVLGLRSASVGLPPVSPPPYYCMPYYREFDAGPVTVVQGGCGNDVKVCGTSVPQTRSVDLSCVLATVTSSSEPMCLYYYYELEVGPVRHVQRDSCHSENYVCGVPLAEFLASTPDPVAVAQCTVDSLGVLA